MRHLSSFLLFAALIVAACDGGQAQPTPAGPATPAPPVEAETVSIFDFGFDPATVSVSVGQSVVWTNDGEVPHTVTFGDGPDSGTMDAGGTFEHTFASAGQLDYVCAIHPAMAGVVNVGP